MTRFQHWFSTRSPRGQWAAGCAGIVLVVTLCLYGLGVASYFTRPLFVSRPAAATVVFVLPTTAPRPTFAPPTVPPTIALPNSTLPATPTQAPIPTRAPPTETPLTIFDPNGTPVTVTPSVSETPFLQQTQAP